MNSSKNKPKRSVLSKYMHNAGYEAIPYKEFYREMFPAGELAEWSARPKELKDSEWRYNGVVLEFTDKKRTVMKRDKLTGQSIAVQKQIVKRHMICDDLQAIDRVVEIAQKTGHFCCMSPISYCGRNRAVRNERFLYVLTIEVDHLLTEKIPGKRDKKQIGMEALLHQWGANNEPKFTGGLYLAPTAITCSGNGVHLHWFLKEPVPLFGGGHVGNGNSERAFQWDVFREGFTDYIWNDAVSDGMVEQEYHGQAFRVVGSKSKQGHLVEAFWISKKRYSIDEIFNQSECRVKDLFAPAPIGCWDSTVKKDMDLTKSDEIKMSLKMQEAKEKWPDWFQNRIVDKKAPLKKGQWRCNRNVYDWYIKQIEQNPQVGCRYWRLYTLAQYGVKCGVPFDEVKRDCYEIGKMFKEIDPKYPLEDWEIEKALEAYFNVSAAESTIDFINEKANLNIQKNKRNGRKRLEHLDRVNKTRVFRRDVLQEDEYAGSGRPTGSGTKQQQVAEWRKNNPNGKKADCIRETGLSKPTVYKWWD